MSTIMPLSPTNTNSHTRTGINLFHNIALVVASSAVTAALVLFFSSNNTSGGNDDNDDFDAHQGQPTTTTTSDNQKHGSSSSSSSIHVPYIHQRLSTTQIRRRSKKLLKLCQSRRTIRFFSKTDPVPRDIISNIIQTAATAPSGAHKQPWTFVAISSPSIKQQIRDLVEQEETINYKSRMRKTWIEDLRPMMDQLHPDTYNSDNNNNNNNNNNNDTDDNTTTTSINIQKPYLTDAPWIIAVFKQIHGGYDSETGRKIDHYYVQESVGIACGLLIVAITNANLVTLTSTPMGAEKNIRQLLERPDHEKLFLLLPVGFPASSAANSSAGGGGGGGGATTKTTTTTAATVPYRNPERKPSNETIVWK